MLNIKEIFPKESYTESEIYEIAEDHFLQVMDTPFNTFTILEVVECFHEKDDVRVSGHRTDCDLNDDDHETVAEFRNDVGDGKRFYLND